MAHSKPSWPLLAIGLAVLAGTLLADPLGLGGAAGIGLRELVGIAAGAGLMASGAWRGAERVTPAACVVVWVWIGLVCGFGDAAHWVVIELRAEAISHQTSDYPWMVPLAYLLAFGAVGVLCAVVTRLWPRLLPLPAMVLVPSFIAAWSVIRIFGWMHEYAGLALAAGIGVSLGRAAEAWPRGLLRAARITTVLMLVLTAGAGIWVVTAAASTEQAALAALPPARPDSKNVVLIVLDTVRADRFAHHGAKRETAPRMDEFAKSGVVFDWAIATAPWTLTSHASMFTGTFPHEQSADWLTPLDGTHPTLAQILARQGWVTAGFVANLGYCGREAGLARGFAHYEDYFVTPGVMVCSTSLGRELVNKMLASPYHTLMRNSATQITDRCLSWLEEQRDRPFFVFLNYYDVHAMYIAPPPYDEMFGKRGGHLYDLQKRSSRWSDWSPAEAQGFVDAYDGCMRYLDHEIGRLLDGLEALGVMDDTLIVITSDHGELFGEHDLQEHQNCLYLPLLRMPLIIRFPGVVPAGRRVPEVVSLADLPATILDLIDVQPDVALPGHSLAPLWSGDPGAPRSPALSEVEKTIRQPPHWPSSQGDMASLLAGGLHYIVNVIGEGAERRKIEELYDVVADPDQLVNLIESRPEDAERMRAALRSAHRP